MSNLLDCPDRAAGTGAARCLHDVRGRARQGAERAQQAGVFASPFFVVGRKHPGKPKRIGHGPTVRRERIDQLKPLQDLGRTEFLLCHFAPADSDWRPQGGYALWRLSGNWPAD